ncbi:GNAT family N-acetyltransferase [Ktedonobacter racemifer]|uniref:GNAT family N-acetyltransferase n=1 Tax=Ktedonobacter racemifer TaxID=363277 RepID=UPI00058D65A6|nr:GNAT family N-acetyltransferase [Ktedonobacter racemifer]
MTNQDLFALAPTLETARLRLRQITLGDTDAIFAFQSDPEVLRYYRSEAFTRLEQTQEYLQRALDTPTEAM